MSVKFLSRLSDKEIFNLFLRASSEKEGSIIFEKIERQDNEFKLYVWSVGYLLVAYCNDFDVFEHTCFFGNIDYEIWRALLYKRFGTRYAIADFENTIEEYGL